MFLEIYEACPSNLSAKKGFTKPMSIIGKISRAGNCPSSGVNRNHIAHVANVFVRDQNGRPIYAARRRQVHRVDVFDNFIGGYIINFRPGSPGVVVVPTRQK